MTMHARLTDQGTAIGETALCATCLPLAPVEFYTADDAVTEHRDCTGNDALECVRCGATA